MRFRAATDMIKRRFAGLSSKWRRQPSGSALDRARSIAFVVQHPDHAKRHTWPDAAQKRGASVDLLPFSLPHRRSDGEVTSFVYTPPRAEYDCIVVDRHIDLFEHSWSYAFLDRLNSLLAKDGAILVPFCTEPARQIPNARLEALFGRAPVENDKFHQTFAKAPNGLHRPPEASLSTLDAYWALMPNLIQSRFDNRLEGVVRALGVARPRKPRETRVDLFEALRRQGYRACSACTKAAMMQFILAQYFPGRRDLHLADVGAGTGLNSLEMLLNPSGVSFVTMVEINSSYHWPIAAAYDWLGDAVRGKVALVGEPGQSFAARPADAAMVCAVFSTLPRDVREAFARNSWDNLAPGGILAVLENMHTGRGEANDENRFTPPEIDALLGRFGPIRCFAADAKKELPAAEVGNLSVFRVVQKPL